MKRKLLSLGLILMLMAAPAFATDYATNLGRFLNDEDGTSMEDYTLTSGAAVYSETIDMRKNIGFSTLHCIEDIAGGAGDVDISVEYCNENKDTDCGSGDWFTPYVSDMAGSITADGLIVLALGDTANATPPEGMIVYTARMWPFMRYKFDPDANSQITVKHTFLRDK